MGQGYTPIGAVLTKNPPDKGNSVEVTEIIVQFGVINRDTVVLTNKGNMFRFGYERKWLPLIGPKL